MTSQNYEIRGHTEAARSKSSNPQYSWFEDMVNQQVKQNKTN